MDQARALREIEAEASAAFGGALRRVSLLAAAELGCRAEYRRFVERNDFAPDEVLAQIVLADPPGRGTARPPEALRMFRRDDGPAIRQFRAMLAERFPQMRHLEVRLEDADGQDSGRVMLVIEEEDRAAGADGGTPVLVRLTGPELETVDTLIAAGIAADRAGAVRWALARVRERPAFSQLQQHAREIERLKSEL